MRLFHFHHSVYPDFVVLANSHMEATSQVISKIHVDKRLNMRVADLLEYVIDTDDSSIAIIKEGVI